MKDLRLAITINKPAKEIFAFTVNPGNTPTWVDSIVTEQANEWPPKVGTVYRNKDFAGVWREIELTEFEQNKMFVFSERDGFHIRYTFKPLDVDKTELECYLWMDEGELLEKLKRVVETKS